MQNFSQFCKRSKPFVASACKRWMQTLDFRAQIGHLALGCCIVYNYSHARVLTRACRRKVVLNRNRKHCFRLQRLCRRFCCDNSAFIRSLFLQSKIEARFSLQAAIYVYYVILGISLSISVAGLGAFSIYGAKISPGFLYKTDVTLYTELIIIEDGELGKQWEESDPTGGM